jgi:dTMP kinase
MDNYRFVTFEGCEGVGKSYQIRALREYLEGAGEDFIVTREPGGSYIAEKIREIILDADNSDMDSVCELMLYCAARAQHLKDIVKPALSRGKLVICDRFIDSTLAYQGYARGLSEETVNVLNRYSVGECMPTLTVFLDLPPELAFERKGGADAADRLEKLDIGFHNRVYEGYKKIARAEPQRFVTVDASGSKAETHQKIVNLLKERKIIK